MNRILMLVAALLVGTNTLSADPGQGPYPVEIIEDSRVTATGDRIDYLLFVPQAGIDLPPPPFPALVLTHGFARSFEQHIDSATRYATQGILTMTPNMVSLLGGPPAQERNIANTADHARWLAARSADPADPIFGFVDPTRIALAGHSAGGAISFEAALELQSEGPAPAALVLLDAVPYGRTLDKAAALLPLDLLSLRSEPSPCNAFGLATDLVARVPFAVEDLRIVGATHCDPEAPTDLLCKLACGGSGDSGQARTYRRITELYLLRTFGLADDRPPGGFSATVRRLERRGVVVSEP